MPKKLTRKATRYSELMESAVAYVAETTPNIQCPADIAKLVRPLFRDMPQECVLVITVNIKHDVLGIHTCTIGLLDRSHLHTREVFIHAIQDHAYGIFLVHNHPSGDPRPSAEDITTTKTFRDAGKLLGIPLMDHVVIGDEVRGHISIREQNKELWA